MRDDLSAFAAAASRSLIALASVGPGGRSNECLSVRSIHFARGDLAIVATVDGPAPARQRRPSAVELFDRDNGDLIAKWVQTVEWPTVKRGDSFTVVLETSLPGRG